MIKIVFYLFKSCRPRQWLKNLAVFAAIIFTGQLFNQQLLLTTIAAFFIFCCASSSNYLFNDVLDAAADRKHPFKKNRPVANGKLPVAVALSTSLILVIFSLTAASLIAPGFLLITFLFLLLQFSYTLFFKQMAVIDILIITLAYVLRIYAGELATGFHISIWLFLAVLSLSLFLAIGKRRAELTLVKDFEGSATRATLSRYSERLLDTYISMTASSTWITYSLFTFLGRTEVSKSLFEIPERKWLMLTIPFVLFGIMRYMQLIYEGKGESPERILTSDKPLMLTVLIWGLTVIFIIYGLGG